jgi:O-antigen/teichoic acid export membrane protein
VAKRLALATGLVFAATVVMNLSAVLYHSVLSRQLGDAYAQLAALLAVSNVLSNVTLGVNTFLVKAFAQDAELWGPGAVGARLRGLALPGGLALGALLLLWTALSAPLAFYLKLPSAALVALVGLLFVSGVAMLALRAAVQGLHHFGAAAASLAGEGAGRVSGAWAWGGSVAGGLWGMLAGQVVGIFFAATGLLRLGPAPAQRQDATRGWRQALGEASADTLTLSLFALLAFLDVMVMKHHQPDAVASEYSRAALVAKSFLYLASALNIVLLPAASRAVAAGEDPRPMLRRFVLGALGVNLLGLAGLWALAPLCLRLLVGPGHEALAPLTRVFGAAAIPLALLQLVLTYLLAVRQRHVPAAMAGLVLLYWGLLEASWSSEERVVLMLGLCSTLGLAAALVTAFRRAPQRLQEAPQP